MIKRTDKDFTLTPKWPEHMPTHCGKCENAYDSRFSLEFGPGRLGRWLRKIAPWMTVMVLALLFLINSGSYPLVETEGRWPLLRWS